MGKEKMKGKSKQAKQKKTEMKVAKDDCCSPSGKDNKSGCGCC